MNGIFWMVPSVTGPVESVALWANQGPGLTELTFLLGEKTNSRLLKNIMVTSGKIWEGNKQGEVKERWRQEEAVSLDQWVREGLRGEETSWFEA